MIQPETRLKVADNSGVQAIGMIRVVGRGRHRYAGLGDQIICSAKQVALPQQDAAGGRKPDQLRRQCRGDH